MCRPRPVKSLTTPRRSRASEPVDGGGLADPGVADEDADPPREPLAQRLEAVETADARRRDEVGTSRGA